MDAAETLTGFERCRRIPFWGVDWKPRKLKPAEMIEMGIMAGLTEQTRSDYGELAGEEVYGLGSDPGLDSKQYDQHSEVVHLAALADVITSAIRRPGTPPWMPAHNVGNWKSGCWLSPDKKTLRQLELVTSWSDDRHYSVCRSWRVLGEVCHHAKPMQLIVVKLGQHKQGKFYSFWAHGLQHPANKKLRFRKRNQVSEPFKETWVESWREDWDNISTETWLQGMLEDGVLNDLLIRVDIPVPKEEHCQRIVELAERKLAISVPPALPDQNLTTCDWPEPCKFRGPCHAQQEPSEAWGLVRIQA